MDRSNLAEVLCRTDLKRGQMTLLKALYDDDDFVATRDDGFVPREELVRIRRMKADPSHNLACVLGAFGRRINETDGVPGRPGTDAFLERKTIDGEFHYRLRREARRAIESVPALLEAFDRPWEQLLEPDTEIPAADLASTME